MTTSEIASLEHASRVAIAWAPERYEGAQRSWAMPGIILPALGFLLVAAVFLFSIV